MKKIFSLFLAILFIFCFIGCNNKPDDDEKLEKVTVRTSLKSTTINILLMSSDMPADSNTVITAVNNQLMKDGKPYQVNIEFATDTNYSVTLEDRAKTGYDAAWSHVDNISDLIEKEVIKNNLMPYLNIWGKKILEYVPRYAFDQFTNFKNDGLYAIPRSMPIANDRSRLLVRKDWMQLAGINEIKDITTLDRYLAFIKEEFEDLTGFKAMIPDYGNAHLLREYCPTYFFPTGSDSYPIYIDIDDPALTVKNFFKTEAFATWVNKSYSYVQQGISPLTTSSSDPEQVFYLGLTGAISDYSVVKMSERIAAFKSVQTEGELYDVFIESENNKKIVFRGSDNCMVVLKNSQSVEETVDFFNWLKDQDNADLMSWGVEGVNYFLTDEGKITFTQNGKSIQTNKRFSVMNPSWAYNDIKHMRWNAYLNDQWIEETVNWEQNDEKGNPLNYRISPLVGFNVYPTEAFLTAYERVSNAMAMVSTLLQGRTDPSNISKLISDTDQAGMNDLIAEVQRQVNEFLQYKNK